MATADAVANSVAHLVGSPAFPVVHLQYSMTGAARLGHVLAPACTDPILPLAHEANQLWRKLPLLELDVPALAVVRGSGKLQRVPDQRLHESTTPEDDGKEIRRRPMIVPMRRSQLAAQRLSALTAGPLALEESQGRTARQVYLAERLKWPRAQHPEAE